MILQQIENTMSILVIGSSNTDLVAKVKSMPKPGETVLGGEFFVNPGGKGANQAVAAARLGCDVTFCCKTGEDDYGKAAKALFAKEGMNTSYVISTPECASGVALIFVDSKGENSIVVAGGANNTLSEKDVDSIEGFGDYKIVLAQLEIPLQTVEHIGALCKSKGVPFILNPAPAQPLSKELLQCVDIITPNETESEILTGIKVTDEATASKAAAALCALGVGKVIITMGSTGAFVYENGAGKIVPAYKAEKVVDTTAAGDVFNGSLAVALSKGEPLAQAVNFAQAAASISVQRSGAQASAPQLNEVMELLNK